MVRAVEPPVLADPYRTERRLQLQAEARQFAMDEVLPVANQLDPQKAEMPAALIEKMGALGYFGIRLPEDVGGMGLGVFEYCMASRPSWSSGFSKSANVGAFTVSVPAMSWRMSSSFAWNSFL